MRIRTLDTHTAGEPLRIVLSGVPIPEGATLLERRRNAAGEWDRWRRLLMFEPRGHADMYGALIVPPQNEGSAFGVLFMHNEGYSTMCGHATIALGRIAVEEKWVQAEEPLTQMTIDTPAGPVSAFARIEDGNVVSSGFQNVPSYAVALDQLVEVPGLGEVRYDLAFGGAYYAYVDADVLGLPLTVQNARAVIAVGMAIKEALIPSVAIRHPHSSDLSYLYGTMFVGAAEGSTHSRHACVFADGALDRSPTGTGVSGRIALLAARNALREGEEAAFESITGGVFIGRFLRGMEWEGLDAVVSEVEGDAFITGRHEFVLEDGDPFPTGFLIR